MRRPLLYRLEGHRPVPCDDKRLVEAGIGARVALTPIDGIQVSTVFLGLDHSMHLSGPPILFETLIIGGPLDGEQRRYATWDEAERGHAEAVARVHAMRLAGPS